MCVQGFFIRTTSLPRFWYYVFHFIDYQVKMTPLSHRLMCTDHCQTYAFEALVKNDLVGLAFNCVNYLKDGSCNCAYPPSQTTLDTLGQCKVTGQDVIDVSQFIDRCTSLTLLLHRPSGLQRFRCLGTGWF